MNSNNSHNGCNEPILEKVVRINVTESDSVHPRFGGKLSETEVQEFHRKYDYFCPVCGAYFAPTLLALKEHFLPGRIKHTYTRCCIYCKGPVYEYSLNERIKLYHDCLDAEKEEANK